MVALSLKWIFGRSVAPRPVSVGNRRVYAIGDVHGCADLLEEVLVRITEDNRARPDVASWQLVFLGDLVDRGPDSKRVVEIASKLAQSIPCISLMGNHEEVMVAALDGNLDALKLFLRYGGYQTLTSYGLSTELLDQGSLEDIHQAMQTAIPIDHQEFLRGLPSCCSFDDYLFVHAGIRPGVTLDQQTDSDMHWIRRDFLEDRSWHEQIVVHGHTISDEIDEHFNRIGIDTGAYCTGRLTAIGLQGEDRWYLTTGDPIA